MTAKTATAAKPGLRWAACSASEFGPIGETRHLVRPGALTTACGASASHPEIWRANSRKPTCKSCARIEADSL